MRNKIEFASSDSPQIPTLQSDRPQMTQWQDLTVKPALRKMKIRFPEGRTLVRILPHIKGGTGTSYVELVQVIKTPGFNVITTPGDLFQRAYSWLLNNKKDTLQRWEKDEKGEKKLIPGINLRPTSQALAWAAYWEQAEDGSPAPRVHLGLMQSAFSSGKNPGLLADIVAAAEATEVEPGSNESSRVYQNSIADATAGRNITITKTVDPKLPKQLGTSFGFAISSKEAGDIRKVLEQIPDEEMNLVSPLSSIVNILTEDEQRALLRNYLGATLFGEIGM